MPWCSSRCPTGDCFAVLFLGPVISPPGELRWHRMRWFGLGGEEVGGGRFEFLCEFAYACRIVPEMSLGSRCNAVEAGFTLVCGFTLMYRVKAWGIEEAWLLFFCPAVVVLFPFAWSEPTDRMLQGTREVWASIMLITPSRALTPVR